MNIQSSINQTLSLASLLATQSPAMKFRKEGMGIQATQEQAIRGLKDIETNLERVEAGEKHYNEAELKNIEARTEQYQKDIYDAKSAALNPKLQKYIKTGEKAYESGKGIQQPALSSQLTRIQEMTKKAREGLTAKHMEHQASKNFVNDFEHNMLMPVSETDRDFYKPNDSAIHKVAIYTGKDDYHEKLNRVSTTQARYPGSEGKDARESERLKYDYYTHNQGGN